MSLYCKICRMNVRSISHWAREHRDLLRRRRSRSPRRPQSRGRESHTGELHFCPMCGARHGG